MIVSTKDNCVILSVRIVPGASRNQFDGIYGESLKIKVQSPPVDGKANLALIKFLAKKIGVKKSDIKILSGETSRNKIVSIKNITEDNLKLILGID